MNMHTDQPRTPAGSPQGGQFATKPGGGEATVGLVAAPTADDRINEHLHTFLKSVWPKLFTNATVTHTTEVVPPVPPSTAATMRLNFDIEFGDDVNFPDQVVGKMLFAEVLTKLTKASRFTPDDEVSL